MRPSLTQALVCCHAAPPPDLRSLVPVQVLTTHVIEGKFTSADLIDGMEITTVAGITLTVAIDGEEVTFTPEGCGAPATVIIPNFGSCESTLHLIDTVLLPGEGCAGDFVSDPRRFGSSGGVRVVQRPGSRVQRVVQGGPTFVQGTPTIVQGIPGGAFAGRRL